MNKYYTLVFISFVLCVSPHTPIEAQFLQDTRGKALIPYLKGALSFNSSDESLQLGFNRLSGAWEYGASVRGKPTNGIASLLQTGDILPDAAIDISIGYSLDYAAYETAIPDTVITKQVSMMRHISDSLLAQVLQSKRNEWQGKADSAKQEDNVRTQWAARFRQNVDQWRAQKEKELEEQQLDALVDNGFLKSIDWISLSVGYRAAEYMLYDPALPVEQQLTRELFKAGSIRIAYNSLYPKSRSILSVSLAVSRDNNTEALERTQITRTSTSKDSTGNIQQTSKKEYTVYKGKYITSTTIDLPASFLWHPSSDLPVSILLHTRYLYRTVLETSSIGYGIGMYVMSGEKSLAPLGGIFVEYEDALNKQETPIPFGKRFKVSLQMSLPFSLPM